MHKEPIGIVIAGCGAVTRIYYAEAFARLQRAGSVQVLGIFDPDKDAMATVHSTLPGALTVTRFEDLLGLGGKVGIVASPPRFHADQAVAALRAGLHVFCEKPLATTFADASRILATAGKTRLSVALGLVRRQFPATQSIRTLLQRGAIGRLRSITCFEGGPFQWPIASPRYFDPVESGGGILQDVGTHCLDLLIWWLGPPREVSYADDAMGGIEANCLLDLHYDEFDARVRLSRDWFQPNVYRIEGDGGSITWKVDEVETIDMSLPAGAEPRTQRGRPGGAISFADCFTAQIEAFVNSLMSGTPPPLTASAGANVLRLVERCYLTRRMMDMPWLSAEEIGQAVEAELAKQ